MSYSPHSRPMGNKVRMPPDGQQTMSGEAAIFLEMQNMQCACYIHLHVAIVSKSKLGTMGDR